MKLISSIFSLTWWIIYNVMKRRIRNSETNADSENGEAINVYIKDGPT